MKRFTLAMLAFTVLAASCTKEETTTPTTTTTTPTSSSPTAPTPNTAGSDISGALISIQMQYKVSQMGIEVPVNSEIGTAVFYSAPGSSTFVDAGAVSVNTYSLDKAANLSYSKLATVGQTPSSLNFSSGSNWNIGGSGSVTAFTYNHSASFPEYTGSVPTTITKSSGVSFTFNSSTLSNADSVIVVIASGSTSVTKTYKKDAGTVTISASELSGLTTVSDNTALVEVCPYRFVTFTTNGKKYVAIKEQAVVKNANIN